MEAKKGRRGTGRTNRKTSRGVCVSVHHNDGSQDSSSLKALTRVYDTSHTELSYNLTCGTGARGDVCKGFSGSSRRAGPFPSRQIQYIQNQCLVASRGDHSVLNSLMRELKAL